jgi:hypothetical protein
LRQPSPPAPSKRQIAVSALFLATGLALPFYAFPVVSISGKAIDLATLFAALFLFASIPELRVAPRAEKVLLVVALAVPLLALTPPVSHGFDFRQFVFSYAHWALVVAFFFAALRQTLSEADRRRLAAALVVLGAAVAAFALYQAVGIPRHWPATGPVLLSFQREPMRFDSGPGYVRPTATFLEPGWLGGYLAWILVLAVALLMAGEGRRVARLARVAAVALLMLALFATVSWGAYADLAAGLGVGALTLRKEARVRRRLPVPLGAAALVGILLIFVSSPGRQVLGVVRSRLGALIHTPLRTEALDSEIRDTSWVRYQNLRHERDLFLAHPLGGVGLGQSPRYAGPGSAPDHSLVDPWCGWLAIAAQMGFLGPILLVMAFFLTGRRYRLSVDGALHLAAPAILGVAAVMQLHTGSFIDLWWWYPMSLAAVAITGDESAVS